MNIIIIAGFCGMIMKQNPERIIYMAMKTSFTEADFELFLIDGLENRMAALKEQIRPKFEELGTYIAPFLTPLLEEPVTTHIAKHARRTVNPPDETWVAWSTNRRGYKSHPHFQLGLNKDYLFICFALIYECTTKPVFARSMKNNLEEVWPLIPGDYYLSQDHTKPHFVLKKEITEETMISILNRLEKVKQAEFLCGLHIPKENISSLQEGALVQNITTTFETVFPLYKLAKEGD